MCMRGSADSVPGGSGIAEGSRVTISLVPLHLQHPLTPMLIVRDVQRSLDFYERALGLRKDQEHVEKGTLWWAKASRGAIELMFQKDLQVQDGTSARRGERPSATLYFCVDDVTTLLADLKAKGLAPADLQAFVTGYGKKEITFHDPSGFEITCAQETDEPAGEGA